MMIQKRGDVDDGVSLLLQRRIQFHPARKPLKPFSANSISNSSFHLETLNPSYYNNQRTSISNSSSASAEQVKDHYTNSPSPVIDPELCFNMSVRRIGAGLENLGNTCYLNSVLQCLTYTEPFAAYLQSGKHKSSCHTAGFCAMCAIQNHVKRALQSSGRILAPNDLVRNLRCISRTFGKARQEDAHEYMVNLLESMHKCCLPSGMPSESPSAYEISLVHKIFGGRLRSQSDSLHKALSHFTAIEQLDGGGRQYQCERCKQKVKALKQLTVDKAPYVLSIHLKRFGSHAPGQKIDKKVEFGPTLDLKPFVSNSNDVDLKYTLYGVLVHAGWSSHSGHYFCFVRTSSGMWHSLDDNRVVQVSERTVMQQKAYMLFYVRDRKIPAPKKQIVRKESLPSDHEKGDMFASVNQKKTFQSALVAARLHTLDSFKKPQVKESCILNIPKSSVMAGAFSHLKDPTSQSSLKVLVNDCAVEQQPNCPSAELHAGSTLSSIVINNVNLQNDYEVERPSNEHSLQKAIDNGLPSMVCDREEQFIKTCKRNKCVQKALTDNNNLPKVLKPKKKVMKLRVASVHLGSRFMIKAMLSSYKKNKKQKTNKCQRLKVKSLIGEKYKKYSVSESLEPSASVKKKLRDLVSTHSERSRKNSCLASGSLSESFCENGSVSMLTRGIEEFTDLKYTLYGVLVHAGWSSHSGHYFCFVRTSSGMWHSLDDNRVVQVSERTVMQQKAYMLFYVRDRKIPAPKKQIVRKESLPSDHEKGDMFASVNQKKTFQSALVAARLHTLDSFKKPQVKESCILNIPKSSVMAGAFSHLKDPTSQSSLKVLVNDCAVEQQPNCPSAELHAGSTLSSIVINNVNLQNDYEVERPSNEHSLQKAIDNGLPSMVCDREEQFIKTCKRNKCVQKALTDNNNLPKVLKPKKKVMKLRVASVHLGSRFMIKAMLSSYKKNKKQKTNKCQRLKVKSLIGEKYKKYSVSESLEPSASVKKKLRDLVSTHSERSRKNSCLASGSLSESFCENGSVSMLTRGIEEFTVARWDEAETSPSEIVVPEKGQDITIGYVPDEWDEEYDRGKRKKVRNPKDSFSGSNPFQELATKKAKLRNVEVGRTASSKKQPLRRK